MKMTKKTLTTVICGAALSVACFGVGISTINASAEDTTVTTVKSSATFVAGATAEGVDSSKMVISASMAKADYEALAKDTKMHVIVAPTDMVASNGLTLEMSSIVDSELTDWYLEGANYDGSVELYNFPSTWYGRSFSWRTYYTVGESVVYSADTWEKCLAETATVAYKAETDATKKEAIEPYCTLTATYDLGIRKEGSNTEWQTVEKTALYGETFEAPAVPTREGFEFVEWKYPDEVTAESKATNNIAVEAIWLLKGEMVVNSIESLYAYADIDIPAKGDGAPMYALSNNEGGGVLMAADGYEQLNMTTGWKNIVVGKAVNYSAKVTTTNIVAGYFNFGYVKGYTNQFLIGGGRSAASAGRIGGLGYEYDFLPYDEARDLYHLSAFVTWQGNLVTDQGYTNNAVINEIKVSATNTYAIPEGMNQVGEGETIRANATAVVAGEGITVANNGFTYTSASAVTDVNPIVFHFVAGEKVAVGEKLVIKFTASEGVTVAAKYNNAATSTALTNDSLTVENGQIVISNAEKTKSVNAIYLYFTGAAGCTVTITDCYILGASATPAA